MKYDSTILLLLFGHADEEDAAREGRQQTDRSFVSSVPSDDEEMNDAKRKAVETLGKFKETFVNNVNADAVFFLKVGFDSPHGLEHMWVTVTTLNDDEYYGTVNNEPQWTLKVKLGDFVKINKKKISDWMIIADGKLYGGYTLRLLRDRMSDEEREEFDASRDYTFAD